MQHTTEQINTMKHLQLNIGFVFINCSFEVEAVLEGTGDMERRLACLD